MLVDLLHLLYVRYLAAAQRDNPPLCSSEATNGNSSNTNNSSDNAGTNFEPLLEVLLRMQRDDRGSDRNNRTNDDKARRPFQQQQNNKQHNTSSKHTVPCPPSTHTHSHARKNQASMLPPRTTTAATMGCLVLDVAVWDETVELQRDRHRDAVGL